MIAATTETGSSALTTAAALAQSFRNGGTSVSQTIPQMVAAQAIATPHAPAVCCGDAILSYLELDRQSNQLARYLQRLGVGPEVPVGLYVERSLAFVTGALAIMKAGGAYLPFDPTWPAERVSSILHDAQAPVLLSHRSKAAGLPPGTWSTVDLDIRARQIAGLSHDPVLPHTRPSQLAYIIYTSGSSGRPKGVEITHENLASLVRWHHSEFKIQRADRASQIAGLGFDAAVWEIWPHLASGASVHIIDEDSRRSPETLRDWLLARQISIAFAPTALAEALIALDWPAQGTKPNGTRLRWLLTGGDTLHRYPAPGLPFQLVNNYGPTECTVLATSGIVRSAVETARTPPIGRPIAEAQVYILDEALRPVPPGQPGELWIAGTGVARGYRNLPELTASKFVTNPFGAGRMYRTGDRGRLLSTGEIAFLGRLDDQVKIRGYRVEPEEIVMALNRHPQIKSAVVTARNSNLTAYLLLEPEAALTSATLREFLSATLPDYMIPAAFVRLERLPLTSAGKIDKTALPEPSGMNTLALTVQDVGAPANAIESSLLETVAGLVGSDAISVSDNFFLIGGHSMLAAQLLVRIRQDFRVAITLRQLFKTPTVSELAREVERLQSAQNTEAAG